MKRFVSGRPYWWQWLTILSLDATLVAVSWQLLFADVARVPLHGSRVFVLAASVWLAYTADRWIEGWRLAPDEVLTQRHYFAVRWRWPQAVLWALVFAADLAVSLRWLGAGDFIAGLILLGPVLLYLLSHQLLHRDHPWRLPKEICVALLMSGGAIVFILPHVTPNGPPLHVAASLWELTGHFAILCFSNCVLISIWESEVDRRHGQDSLARSLGRLARASRAIPVVLAVETAVVAWLSPDRATSAAYACLSASSVLLVLVDRLETRMGRQLARVLADVVLLTPLIALLLRP